MAERASTLISIRRGLSANNIKLLSRLRKNIYHDDPNWIAPLPSQIALSYSADHPYLLRGKSDLFIVLLGDTPVAAAMTFFDDQSAAACGNHSAYFSGFECVNDVAIAERLISALQGWANEQGARELLGPMSPRLSDPRGVLIEGDGPPIFGMAYSPNYYDQLLSSVGFGKAIDLFEFIVKNEPEYPRLEKVANLAKRRFPGLRLRPFDLDNMEREFAAMAEIYNQAWRSNWGFMPLDVKEFLHTAGGLKRILGPACAVFVEIDGRPVGFQIVVPNINSAIKAIKSKLWPFGFLRLKSLISKEKTFRALFIGVLPQYRKTGIEAILIQSGLATGAEQFHIGWVLENNFAWKSEIENITGGTLGIKKYRIYRRACEEQSIEKAA
jgi:GNAT superfamily N-acetyltransferase